MSFIRSRKLRIALIALALVLIALVLLVPLLLDIDRYRPLITRELTRALDAEVVLGELSWGISNGLWVEADGLRVSGSNEIPLDLDLPSVFAKIAILPLLYRQVVIKRVSLDAPSVVLRLDPVEDGPEESASTESPVSASPLPIEIEALSIEGGVLTVRDAMTREGSERVTTIEDVEIEIRNLAPGREIDFRFAFQDTTSPGLGRLEGRGSFSGLTEALSIEAPELRIDLSLGRFDTEVLHGYLGDASPLAGLSGLVSLDLEYRGDLGRHLSAEGRLDLSELSYSDLELWEQALPGRPTTLDYRLELNPTRIRLDRFELKLGGLSLTGDALVQDWDGDQARLTSGSLRGELPLDQVVPLVPWRALDAEDAETLRSVLSGGGLLLIEELTLPELMLVDLPAQVDPLVQGLEASLRLSDIAFKPEPDWPAITDIAGRVRLDEGVLNAEQITGRFRAVRLPSLSARVTGLTGKPRFAVEAKGPLELAAADGPRARELLQEFGLRELDVRADVDLTAGYDTRKPDRWRLDGSLVFNGVTARSEPDGVRLRDLHGRLAFKRSDTLALTVDGLSARINDSPIALDGRLTRAKDGSWVVASNASAQRLDLAELAALVPELKQRGLSGRVDADLDVRYDDRQPAATRLRGRIQGRDLGLQTSGRVLTEGQADVLLSGQAIELKKLQLLIDGQSLDVTGRLSDPHAPSGSLRIGSPSLDLDRLMAGAAEDGPKDEDRPDTAAEPEGTAQLPSRLRDANLDLQVAVDQGVLRQQPFRDLKVALEYADAVLKRAELATELAGGQLALVGTADLGDLERVAFRITPDLQAVPMTSLQALLGSDSQFIQGPLTLRGEIAGRTGPVDEAMRSLSGSAEAELGPGRMAVNSVAGRFVLRVLSTIQLRGLLPRGEQDDAESGGIPYDSLRVEATLKDGVMALQGPQLVTPAIRADSAGDVDLVAGTLNMSADVVLLGSVGAVLGRVPLVGGAATDLTSVHLDIDGPLAEPRISVRPLRGLTRGLGRLLRGVGRGIGSTLGGAEEADPAEDSP